MIQRHFFLALLIAFSIPCMASLSAANDKFPGQMTADQLQGAGFKPLAEGDSLAEWNMKPWHAGHWTIKDGVINYDGKAKGKFQDNSLWTKKSYGDFEMYAEWRLP